MSARPHHNLALGAPASLPARRRAGSLAGMPATPTITRRQFFRTATTVAVSAGLIPASAQSRQSSGTSRRSELIDTNITLGRWPFRRLPLDDTAALVARLRKQGVTRAWAGNFDALLHKDLAASNARLVGDCLRYGRGLLTPFGSVNPKLPGWEEDFRRCVDEHKMPGLRLYPDYHDYKLDDLSLAKLFSLAAERRLIVQVAVSMEDERMQSPLALVPHVDASPLVELIPKFPTVPVVLLNWQRAVNSDLSSKLAAVGEVCFEIATLEGVGGVAKLLKQIPPQRVLFGSHAPLFYFESALLKLKESALSGEQEQAVCSGNARRLLQH